MKRVTQAEFARLAGVNRSTVTRWLQNGRIQADPSRLIDPDAALKMRAATESPLPHHQARKEQWKILRGMSPEEMAAYHAEIKERRIAINKQIKAKNTELRMIRRAHSVEVIRANKKAFRQSPEYLAYARAYQKKISENLTDAFIIKTLGKEFATPDLIALKREQIAIKRALSDLNDVIQTEQEKNHE